jgi:hypothetical protein
MVEEAGKKAPHAIEVHWRKRKLGSLELASPLLAIKASDLDGDHRAELVLLTTTQVIVAALRPERRLEVIAEAQLPATPPAVRSRDPVGVLSIEGDEVRARTSEQAEGVAFVLQNRVLVERRRFKGFPLCGSASVELATGRNYFDGESIRWNGVREHEVPPRFYAALCQNGLRDADGFEMELFAAVDVERVLAVSCTRKGAACRAGPAQDKNYEGVGYAFEVADIDSDGHPEVITSKGQAPGDSDQVTVYSRQRKETKAVLRESFQGGVVGLTSGDLDGNGAPEVLAAVRLVGSNRVDVWALNQ